VFTICLVTSLCWPASAEHFAVRGEVWRADLHSLPTVLIGLIAGAAALAAIGLAGLRRRDLG
jgi:hypothetical protein